MLLLFNHFFISLLVKMLMLYFVHCVITWENKFLKIHIRVESTMNVEANKNNNNTMICNVNARFKICQLFQKVTEIISKICKHESVSLSYKFRSIDI